MYPCSFRAPNENTGVHTIFCALNLSGDEEDSGDVSQIPTERVAYPLPPDLAHRERARVQDHERERVGPTDSGDTESRHRHRRTHSVPNTEVSVVGWGMPHSVPPQRLA